MKLPTAWFDKRVPLVICGALSLALLSATPGCKVAPVAPSTPTARTGAVPRPASSLSVRSQRLLKPRPLNIHVATIDLTQGSVELVCAAAPDPDGLGAATTKLLTPTVLFTNAALHVAVNANAFATLASRATGSAGMYVEQAPARFLGLVAVDGRVRNVADRVHVSFWVDKLGRPHIGMPGSGDAIRMGVAGFGRLLDNGAVQPRPGEKNLEPRTAIGYSADRHTVWLVVVDGREQGVSEGMSLFELAEFMRNLGASEALNLDGGGSSVMLYARPDEAVPVVRIVNRPSTRFLGQPVMRPIPVMIGARQRRER